MPTQPARVSHSEVPEALPAFLPFGRFQLVARLGKGGMGDVFLAVVGGVEGASKLLVIKRLRETLADDESMRALFLAEGRLAARLSHPNVVQTYEVGQEGEALYLSMEFLEGQSVSQLHKRLGAEPVDHVIAARILSEALAGVHYAHELADYDGRPLGLVHRDVSPQNVFVTYEGVTKVLDFGIAKLTDAFQKTQDGVLKGKVAYMAPEQVAGDVDRRSDVFSAGIVLWELLARKRLMAQKTMANTLYQVMSGPPVPRLSTIVKGIDPTLDSIVARALQRQPKSRFQTAQEMREALEDYIAKSRRFVRQEDLAHMMTSLFRSRREYITQQVRAFMRAAHEARSTHELPAISGTDQATPITSVPESQVPESAPMTPTNANAVLSVPEPPGMSDTGHTLTSGPPARMPQSGRKRGVLYAGAFVLLSAVSVGVYLKLPRPQPTVAPVAEETAPPPSAAVQPAVSSEPKPAPADSAEADSTESEEPPEAEPGKKKKRATTRWKGSSKPASTPEASPAPKAESAPPPTSTAAPTSTSGKRKFRTEF